MKVKKLFFIFFYSIFFVFLNAQETIDDVIKEFDSHIMNTNSGNVNVAVGFITFKDSNSCGSVVSYFDNEIRKSIENTRRLKLIETSQLSEEEQVVVATRSLNLGLMAKNKSSSDKKFIIDGVYEQKSSNIELILTLRDESGKEIKKGKAIINETIIKKQNLSLYPENIKITNEIQHDFDSSKNNEKSSIQISASMLDYSDNLVNVLYPNDIIKFKIITSHDCYISILLIAADGEKSWLPIDNNYMRGGEARYFPDIPGAVLRVVDGFFGAEQVVIYAASNRSELPQQEEDSKYNSNDLKVITRKFELQKSNQNVTPGVFKITYTVMRR